MGHALRFIDVARQTARQLDVDARTVAYIVEGWFHVAGARIAEGHSVATPIAIISSKPAHARTRRVFGYRRDLKIKTRKRFRATLDRMSPDRTRG